LSLASSGSAAAVVWAALTARDLMSPRRAPKVLEIGTVILLGALAVYAVVAELAWSIVGGSRLRRHGRRRLPSALCAGSVAACPHHRHDPGDRRRLQVSAASKRQLPIAPGARPKRRRNPRAKCV
jgi:hypothetical protein